MTRLHHYKSQLIWTGNSGSGTLNYKSYDRSFTIKIDNKPDLKGSSETSFRGDPTKYNPEELLLSALSSCHMLWFLHLCADANIIVIEYTDEAKAIMSEKADGSGQFTEVLLQPKVIVAELAMIEEAEALHKKANKMCFIANSVNFPVQHSPVTLANTAIVS